jgi:hypothetical protein
MGGAVMPQGIEVTRLQGIQIHVSVSRVLSKKFFYCCLFSGSQVMRLHAFDFHHKHLALGASPALCRLAPWRRRRVDDVQRVIEFTGEG